jgi:Family of unknown function (DUF7009)
MKLRVRGNSIRLRLSQADLASLLASGAVEERLAFPSGQSLSYRLESGAESAAAELSDRGIVVRFPAEALRRWAQPDKVSLQAEQPLGGGDSLQLLVEKDFKCLNPREAEDDADLFPNPGA